ncbi:MAG: hypothetical protein AAB505_00610 [Patescibacteria group bacterium]
MKKITKTKTVKKVSSKKKKVLVIANNQNAFWVYRGPTLRSLFDLAKFLEIMTDEQFVYHTARKLPDGRTGGNDFVPWISQVLADRTCAAALGRAHTRNAALAAVRRALAGYNV